MSSDIPTVVSELKADKDYFQFVNRLRKIMDVKLGGNKQVHPKHDLINKLCLSLSESDNYTNLPFRVQLSSFENQGPITSFGAILFNEYNGIRHFILTRRSMSIEFIDLIRGNYRLSHLYFIVRMLSNTERTMILHHLDNFEELWKKCFQCGATESSSYKHAKQMFDKLSPYFHDIFNICPSADPDGLNLYIFPKGRPDSQKDIFSSSFGEGFLDTKITQESSIECAMREFREETNGMNLDIDWIVHDHPCCERFIGTNSKNYATYYFIFKSELEKLPHYEDCIWVKEEDMPMYLSSSRKLLYNLFSSLKLQKQPLKDIYFTPTSSYSTI